MNLVDSSGWVEFFFEGRNAAVFCKPILRTEALIVPVVCIYEVFKKVCLAVNEARALQAVAQMKQGKVCVVTDEIALNAAQLSIQYKLPMADSLIYATAKEHKAVVWTQDVDFKDLPAVNYFPA
jgi:toxin FitB